MRHGLVVHIQFAIPIADNDHTSGKSGRGLKEQNDNPCDITHIELVDQDRIRMFQMGEIVQSGIVYVWDFGYIQLRLEVQHIGNALIQQGTAHQYEYFDR